MYRRIYSNSNGRPRNLYEEFLYYYKENIVL